MYYNIGINIEEREKGYIYLMKNRFFYMDKRNKFLLKNYVALADTSFNIFLSLIAKSFLRKHLFSLVVDKIISIQFIALKIQPKSFKKSLN